MLKKFTAVILIAVLAGSFAACQTQNPENTATSAVTATAQSSSADSKTDAATTDTSSGNAVISTANVTAGGKIDATDLFSDRDLTQTADLSGATKYTVSDGQQIEITAAGVYVLSGEAKNVTVTVDAGKEDKVQLVLDGVSVTNTDAPCIYVKNADKVFVTTTQSDNTLSVIGSFTADGTTNTDAVIFSKDDVTLNGLGTLTISSTANGVSSKDEIKITGGTLNITSAKDALEANDMVAVAGGTIGINTQKDGIHAENDEDNTVGAVYICGGTMKINAASDGIQATTVAQIDDGDITIDASEGIEATYVQINGGKIVINASDDGINASNKSTAYEVTVEINGGDITIDMGQGDTDAIDSNGNLYINGGTLNITAQSPFDYDKEAKYTGGTMIVNGEETTEITNQFGGMGGMGGPGGAGGMEPPGGFDGGVRGNAPMSGRM